MSPDNVYHMFLIGYWDIREKIGTRDEDMTGVIYNTGNGEVNL